ncbi:MAG: autotransporter assembly complex family protein [Candidatus Competibacteraceae bacterium]
MSAPAHLLRAGMPRLGAWLALWLWLTAGWAEPPSLLVVYIEGVDGELRENVAAYLEIRQLAGEPVTDPSLIKRVLDTTKLSELIPLTSVLDKAVTQLGAIGRQPVSYYKLQVGEARLRQLNAQAEDNIREALQPFGYYHPTVGSSLERKNNDWVARYKIEPGPPVRISRVDIQLDGAGRDDPAFRNLVADSPLEPGERLVQPRYEEFKKKLELLASQRGYFKAQWQTHEIRINLVDNSAAIELKYDTGRRYYFGRVHWPETALAPEFLQRYLQFQPGDPYDSDALLNLQSNLINSGYFRQVEVAAPQEKAVDDRVPVDIGLHMRNPRQYSFGLGYGTGTGVRSRFGFEQRWLNPWGDKFKLDLLASRIFSALKTEYTIPGADPARDAYLLRSSLSHENSPVTKADSASVGAGWKRQFGLWQVTTALDYSLNTFNVGERQSSYLLIPSLDLLRVKTDDPLNIGQGTRLDLQLRGAYEPLLSSVSFVQGTVSGGWVERFAENHRFIVRGELGTTLVSDFEKLPPALRFFAGGDNSVRGYGWNRIAPRDNEGNIVGGKNLIVGSVEYEYRFWKDWGVATFVDSGDAFDRARPSLKTGVGVGFRWFSPVGPLRIDLAHGLENNNLIRFYINFGPEL